MTALRRQPDDPGIAFCPCCRRPWPDEDADLEGLIRKNFPRCTPAEIARAANVPLSRLRRVAAQAKPPIKLDLPKEQEPRGL